MDWLSSGFVEHDSTPYGIRRMGIYLRIDLRK
jgi:hypothetical protein